MQATVSRISPVVIELSVEVPADAVRVEIDKAYLTLAKKAHIRGFRPGKAPREVLTRLFGSQVVGDVMNALVNQTLPQVLTEKNVTPITQPNVEPGKLDAKTPFAYKARFEVTPDVEDVKFEGFALSRPSAEVADTMVDEEMEGLRTRHAALKTPEPARAAKAGDVVTIDFTVEVEGKEIKDGGGQGVQLELGAGQALPELDSGLTGKSIGDKAEIAATFGDNHPRPDFRAKKGVFHVAVTDVKERILPALDDEFAKDVGNFQTIIELRADVHTKLTKVMKDRAEMSVAEQIVAKLNDENPLDVPPSLVDQQKRVMQQEVLQQARRLGQRLTQEQLSSMDDQIKADAEKKVRAGLLMAAIARKLEMKVTDDDMEKGLVELSEETGKNVAKLRVEYREKSKRDMLIGMILEDKILDFLESKSNITDLKPGEELPKIEAKAETKTEAKAEKKAEPKAEAKAAAKAEPKPAAKEEGEKKSKKKEKKDG